MQVLTELTDLTGIRAIHILDEFGNDCPIFTKDLTECDEIYVEYNGKDVVSPCNKFKFRGRGKEILDEYSICVTPLNFNDRTCAVEVYRHHNLFKWGSYKSMYACTSYLKGNTYTYDPQLQDGLSTN